MRLTTLHETFLRDILGQGKAPKTIATYRHHFGLWRKYVRTDDLRALTQPTLVGYAGWLREYGLARESVRGCV